MRKIVQLLLFALIGMMFTMCDSDNIHIGNVRLSLCDLSFFGDSTAVFIAKNLQNGYHVSLIHNKQLDIVHFERGDSISHYCAIHKLPFDLRHYEEDSIGVFVVDIDIPIVKLDTLGGSICTPDMFFMDTNFDGEEEFIITHDGYNRTYYACFDLVKGNRNSSCPGLLEANNEPPYNNIVSGISQQPSYTVFDRKKKEIYIYETMGCCSYYETWARYFEGDQYGNEPAIKIVKKVDHEWWADGTEHVDTYKLINDTLKLIK
jgi:hypothetical protein